MTNKGLKIGSYLSYKQWLFDNIFLDLSLYHQASFKSIISSPRLASSSKAAYQFNDYLQLVFMYQNLYDYEPVVPIKPWFHRFISTLSVSF
ncbi:hypothetical protein JNM05_10550 [bacterium]|nr:hypothetical protein [bacterium]